MPTDVGASTEAPNLPTHKAEDEDGQARGVQSSVGLTHCTISNRAEGFQGRERGKASVEIRKRGHEMNAADSFKNLSKSATNVLTRRLDGPRSIRKHVLRTTMLHSLCQHGVFKQGSRRWLNTLQ